MTLTMKFLKKMFSPANLSEHHPVHSSPWSQSEPCFNNPTVERGGTSFESGIKKARSRTQTRGSARLDNIELKTKIHRFCLVGSLDIVSRCSCLFCSKKMKASLWPDSNQYCIQGTYTSKKLKCQCDLIPINFAFKELTNSYSGDPSTRL